MAEQVDSEACGSQEAIAGSSSHLKGIHFNSLILTRPFILLLLQLAMRQNAHKTGLVICSVILDEVIAHMGIILK